MAHHDFAQTMCPNQLGKSCRACAAYRNPAGKSVPLPIDAYKVSRSTRIDRLPEEP